MFRLWGKEFKDNSGDRSGCEGSRARAEGSGIPVYEG